MTDGSFRAIIPTSLSAASFTLSGKYILTDGKTLNFTGTLITAGTLTAGKYYTLQTNTQLGTQIRGLQSSNKFTSSELGNFFYCLNRCFVIIYSILFNIIVQDSPIF